MAFWRYERSSIPGTAVLRNELRRTGGVNPESTLGEVGAEMKSLSDEKIKALAERNGWSLAFARGYVEGETRRRRGTAPTKHAQVGIDEFSLGFRAGYYERSYPRLTQSFGATTPSVRGRQAVQR